MRRREFIRLLALAATSAGAYAESPTANNPKRLKFLLSYKESDPEWEQFIPLIRASLAKLGWHDGQNLSIEFRTYRGEPGLAKKLAIELVELRPDVIVTNSTIGFEAVRLATRTVPTIFIAVSDPVGAGYVTSLARPGGNATGFASFTAEMGGKWLELLRTVAPHTSRVAVLMDPTLPDTGRIGGL